MPSWLDALLDVARREREAAATPAPAAPPAQAPVAPYLGQGAPMPGAEGQSRDAYMRAMLELLRGRPR